MESQNLVMAVDISQLLWDFIEFRSFNYTNIFRAALYADSNIKGFKFV